MVINVNYEREESRGKILRQIVSRAAEENYNFLASLQGM
jgi:hypothetical protein